MSDKKIAVYSPGDGRLIRTYSVSPPRQIDRSIARARQAGAIWASYAIDRRLDILQPLQARLNADIDKITECVCAVTGKVKTEVLLGEIYPLLDMLSYYRKHAAAILAPRAVSTSPLAFPNAAAEYKYKPYGVVAVISPWNYPLQLTLYPLLSALIAGNGVVFKTSELSLPIGELILELLASLDLPEGLVQWVVGGPESGRQLIEYRPDLVFFTGGLNAGRSVMSLAARHPIPVLLELGGKDAMVVFADAPIERAVNAAIYGAFSNSGQVCVAVERLYVESRIYPAVIERLCEAVAELKTGGDEDCDIGAISSSSQLAVIEAQYRDALARGAQVSGPLERDGAYLRPVIVWDVGDDMRIMREETFGPLLAVMPFDAAGEVVHRVNAGETGLNASIWSGDVDRACRIAEQLQVGNWVVNDVLKNVGHPGLPFGGIKNSGFGRYHGAEGLRSFTYTVSGLVSRAGYTREPNWFPYSKRNYRALRAFLDLLFGEGSVISRGRRNWRDLRAFQQYAGLNIRQHWRNFLIFISRRQH